MKSYKMNFAVVTNSQFLAAFNNCELENCYTRISFPDVRILKSIFSKKTPQTILILELQCS